MKTLPIKDPSEVLLCTFDFTTNLAVGETISTATATATYIRGPVTPSDEDLTNMVSGSATISGMRVAQVLTGGFHDNFYELQMEITTSAGQTIEQTVCVPVQEF